MPDCITLGLLRRRGKTSGNKHFRLNTSVEVIVCGKRGIWLLDEQVL